MLLIENKKGRRGIDGQIAFFKCPSIEFKRHLHPHHSVLNIVLDGIQNLLSIGDSQNLEIHYLFRTIPVHHSGDTRSLFCE